MNPGLKKRDWEEAKGLGDEEEFRNDKEDEEEDLLMVYQLYSL